MKDETSQGETALAFRYLVLFRQIVVSLAAVGAVLAWTYEYPALLAAFVCVGIGELLESSYYLSVLRWRKARRSSRVYSVMFGRASASSMVNQA